MTPEDYLKHKNWLVIGTKENWLTCLSQPTPLWGLRSKYKASFEILDITDLLWLYVTNPVKGIIGIGHVIDKYFDDQTLIWQKELEKGYAIWIYKFRFKLLKIIPPEFWQNQCIKISDFDLNWQIGFQLLDNNLVLELVKRSLTFIDQNGIYVGPSIVTHLSKEKLQQYNQPHEDLKQKIAEIGKLQHFYTEVEYSITLKNERKNLDVVWKRELQGAPTYAFEVELSGNIEKALDRLKYAHKIWNTKPRLVISKENKQKVENLIHITDFSFTKDFRFIFDSQIDELFIKKKELRDYEALLGIYDIY